MRCNTAQIVFQLGTEDQFQKMSECTCRARDLGTPVNFKVGSPEVYYTRENGLCVIRSSGPARGVSNLAPGLEPPKSRAHLDVFIDDGNVLPNHCIALIRNSGLYLPKYPILPLM